MKGVLERAFGPGGRVVVARAPGRVNLIGEHTDYNGGFVLPMAIDAGIQVAGRRRAGRDVRLYSADYAEADAFSLDAPIARSRERGWSNYPRGVMWALQEQGIELPGMELAFGGDLPQGAGLSSSAALEVATALVVQALTGFAMASGARTADGADRLADRFPGHFPRRRPRRGDRARVTLDAAPDAAHASTQAAEASGRHASAGSGRDAEGEGGGGSQAVSYAARR